MRTWFTKRPSAFSDCLCIISRRAAPDSASANISNGLKSHPCGLVPVEAKSYFGMSSNGFSFNCSRTNPEGDNFLDTSSKESCLLLCLSGPPEVSWATFCKKGTCCIDEVCPLGLDDLKTGDMARAGLIPFESVGELIVGCLLMMGMLTSGVFCALSAVPSNEAPGLKGMFSKGSSVRFEGHTTAGHVIVLPKLHATWRFSSPLGSASASQAMEGHAADAETTEGHAIDAEADTCKEYEEPSVTALSGATCASASLQPLFSTGTSVPSEA